MVQDLKTASFSPAAFQMNAEMHSTAVEWLDVEAQHDELEANQRSPYDPLFLLAKQDSIRFTHALTGWKPRVQPQVLFDKMNPVGKVTKNMRDHRGETWAKEPQFLIGALLFSQ